MKLAALVKRASFSLTGHIVLFQFFFAIPMALLFTWLNYSDGTLTPSWGLWIIFVSSVGGIAVAVLGWYTVSKPLIRATKGKNKPNL